MAWPGEGEKELFVLGVEEEPWSILLFMNERDDPTHRVVLSPVALPSAVNPFPFIFRAGLPFFKRLVEWPLVLVQARLSSIDLGVGWKPIVEEIY